MKSVNNLTNTSNFHPLEVVGRGSETQLQVGEKLNKITSPLRGYQSPINKECRITCVLLLEDF